MHMRDLAVSGVSAIRPSVARWYWVTTNNRRIMRFLPRYLTLKNIVILNSRLGVTHPANLCTICKKYVAEKNPELPFAADKW